MGSVSGQAITLANSIIGVGILAIPFCFQQCGIILSIVLLILSGFMSRLASHFLLKSAIRSRRRNFEVLAFHIFGNAGKFCVEIGIIGFLMGTCIAYFVVVGDLGPQIIAKMFNIDKSDNLRTSVMVILTLFCVLPLGLLKNVDSLSNVCAITIGFYFCLVIKIIAEATAQMFTGDWIFKVEYWQPDGVLRCLPIFSMSLFCQTQLFEIYDTLPNASLEKMNLVTKNAVSICSVVYVLVGFFGYVAFCNHHISGNILTNLSPNLMSDIIKLGFVLSLAFSFPLIIFPCRVSLYSLFYKRGQVAPHDLISNMMPDLRFKYLTVFIIGTTLLISLMIPNIELVLGFIGSTIGVIICVIFPATCFICISVKNTNERILAQIILCIGIIIMVLGTYANLEATETDSINNKNILEHSLKIKQDHFFNENKIKHIYPVDLGIVDKNKLSNDLNKKVIENVKEHGKKDSRLEPPNPVPPKDDITTKVGLVKNKESQLIGLEIDKKEERLESPLEAPKIIEQNVVKDVSKEKFLNEVIAPEAINKKEDVDQINIPNQKLDDKIKKTESKDIETIPKVTEKDNSVVKSENEADVRKQILIETLMRHEKEQKDMVLVQEELLMKLKKTKKEMEEEGLLKKAVSENTIDKDDSKLNAEESKKIAVEKIQKLAKIAIESLGGNFEMLTEKSNSDNVLQKDDNKEKPMPIKDDKKLEMKNNIENNLNHVEKKNEETNKNHIHKEDEPESYRVGENVKTAKNIERQNELIEKAIIVEKPPIPIALSIIKKNTSIINTEQIQPIIVKDEVKVNETNGESVKQIPEEKNDLNIDNHVAGKRDILAHSKNDYYTDDNELISKRRHKRDIKNCVNNHSSKMAENNFIEDGNADLKLSLTLSEPENEFNNKKQSHTIDAISMSKSDFLKHHIRHLQSLRSTEYRKK